MSFAISLGCKQQASDTGNDAIWGPIYKKQIRLQVLNLLICFTQGQLWAYVLF